MKRIAIPVLMLCALAACARLENASPETAGGREKSVCIRISNSPGASAPALQDGPDQAKPAGLPLASKSSVSASEDGIYTLDIYFYYDGSLVDYRTVHSNPGGAGACEVEVSLRQDAAYEMLVIANSPVRGFPSSLEEALAQSYRCGGAGEWSAGGLPMCGRASISVTESTDTISVGLTRLVARLDLTIDTSGMSHGSIEFTSVAVRHMSLCCSWFASSRAEKASDVGDGDCSAPGDLSRINLGGRLYSTSYYLMENRQGTLLGRGTRPDDKTPDNLRSNGRNPDVCTFVEVQGIYRDNSGALTGEPLTARFFPGLNASTDFSIVRNMQYAVKLVISDEGYLRTDWKMEARLDDRRVLSFENDKAEVEPMGNVSVHLDTNLDYSRGDFTYRMTGDLMSFFYTVSADGTDFSITTLPSAEPGSTIGVEAVSWDGVLSANFKATLVPALSTRYKVEWENGNGSFYVGQSRVLKVVDTMSGGAAVTSGVSVESPVAAVGVKQLSGGWKLSALAPSQALVEVSLNGRLLSKVPVTVQAPRLRFPSERIFLPLDGADADAGPYYTDRSGHRMQASDFDTELYANLLRISVANSQDASERGAVWQGGARNANPVVKNDAPAQNGGTWPYRIARLSYNGVSIADNYDFEAGEVPLQTLTASPANASCGVEAAVAKLYTADPFRPSFHLGAFRSTALSEWEFASSHDETFSFTLKDLVRDGNSLYYASLTVPGAYSGCCDASMDGVDAVKLTLKYGLKRELAMPRRDFSIAPVMKNRHSYETFASSRRYGASFTVVLAVGGVFSWVQGGWDISVEWCFPLSQSNLLARIAPDLIVSNAGAGTETGLYNTLYTLYGNYTPFEIRNKKSPEYKFCDLSHYPHHASLPLESVSYSVPETAFPDYELEVWNYGWLYLQTMGWLQK